MYEVDTLGLRSIDTGIAPEFSRNNRLMNLDYNQPNISLNYGLKSADGPHELITDKLVDL